MNRHNNVAAKSVMAWALLAASAAAAPALVEGRFGQGIAPAAGGFSWAEAGYRVEYGELPVTFECWVRVNETTTDGVIASFGSTRENGHHWAIICHAGFGEIGLQAAGLRPDVFRGRAAIGDGKWHHVALLLEERRVRVLVDGAEAIIADAEPSHRWKQAGPLCFGGYYHLFSAGNYPSAGGRQPLRGVIDEARLSKGIRENRGSPSAPFEADAQTLGLWHFDEIVANRSLDASALNNPVFIPDMAGKSMDELDMEEFGSPPSLLDGEATPVELQDGAGSHPQPAPSLSLDGDWEMREDKRAVPDTPAVPDAQAVGLWQFDEVQGGKIKDGSRLGNAIVLAPDDSMETVLTPGRFGQALTVRPGRAALIEVPGRPEYRRLPLTITCWAKFTAKDGYGFALASEPKRSGTHWEIYTQAGTGKAAVYLPGFTPSDHISGRSVTDGQWHFLEMILEENRVRLCVDGEGVLVASIKRDETKPSVDGPLTFGSLNAEDGGVVHATSIDDVRIVHAVRESNPVELATRPWPDAVPAAVPGSVHAALVKAGRLPDPVVGKNQQIAEQASYKTWWLRRTFKRPEGFDRPRLVFDGVCSSCEVWLNGRSLGTHIGMFGGPSFDLDGLLQEENTLLVRLDPARDWQDDVVFNNCYGWHYCKIPARGIWRSVRIEGSPAVSIGRPFFATRDAAKGVVDMIADLNAPSGGWSGTLAVTIRPDGRDGKTHRFAKEVRSDKPAARMHLRVTIPQPRLWWPNDIGEQNLYRATVSFTPAGGGVADVRETTFGIRTVEMAPLPGGPRYDQYNWTFVINGRPMFVKGNNWCTMDPLMDFSRQRYERFISLAKSQHIQMFRPWGSGMPETDEFYDLCDRYGIMVMQEWPTAWNSHERQPFDALDETVRLNTVRLRNHPSLVMWGANNETPAPFGEAIAMMGCYSRLLDGSRPYHRAEPWGGSQHNYDCYWGGKPLDIMLELKAGFWGEFGIACMPSYESVQRYLPDDEKDLWPAPPDGSFWHHTPIFNTAQDQQRLERLSALFTKPDTMQGFVIGSQLAQATGVRHTLELARTRWPQCSGALYYKMNDNYPAASWSCVDWYGVPKIAHYVIQDSFAPLLACVIFDRYDTTGEAISLPVYLLDDTDMLRDSPWKVAVRAFDADLNEIRRQNFDGNGAIDRVRKLGEFPLTARQNRGAPLFTVAEVSVNGKPIQRTFYWSNFEQRQGCLRSLPKTTLAVKRVDRKLTITNNGELPAVGVHVVCPKVSDRLLADDGHFWLDPGETREVSVNIIEGIDGVAAWNAELVPAKS